MKRLLPIPEIPMTIDPELAQLHCTLQHKSVVSEIIDTLHENECDIYDALCIVGHLVSWLLAHFPKTIDAILYGKTLIDLIRDNLLDLRRYN